MKKRFNNFMPVIFAVILFASCSTSRKAIAQEQPPPPDNGYYGNDDNQQDDQYNNDQNNDDYDDNGSQRDVNINVFVNELSPYGRWVNYPAYGQVWIANERGFTPYQTRGHWVYTYYGWTWVSDYRWGWAPFHYGRWAYEAGWGWMWIPGYQWGPAWVGWRSGGGYYGWTPLGPGININFGFNFGYNYPANRWCFVPYRYITSPRINHYYVNNTRNVTIIRNTTIINNTNIYNNRKVVTGPSSADVQRNTGQRVQQVKIVNTNKATNARVSKNEVKMYRPGTGSKETVQNVKQKYPVNQQKSRQQQVPANTNQKQQVQPFENNGSKPQNRMPVRRDQGQKTNNSNSALNSNNALNEGLNQKIQKQKSLQNQKQLEQTNAQKWAAYNKKRTEQMPKQNMQKQQEQQKNRNVEIQKQQWANRNKNINDQRNKETARDQERKRPPF
ncbi:MAG: hypothetical protein JSS67_10210 [Bacteroidetes bacterium]|nr:hypothetical protein [Bacteroidota bacterium]